jgi:ubiquitin C-terminal hydrolase
MRVHIWFVALSPILEEVKARPSIRLNFEHLWIQYAPSFQGHEQQDAQELFQVMMDATDQDGPPPKSTLTQWILASPKRFDSIPTTWP